MKKNKIELYAKESLKKADVITKNTKTISKIFSTENSYDDENRTRFSDQELNEFKELILSKLQQAKIDYQLFKNILSLSDDNGTNDTSPTFKLLEDAGDVLSKEETARLAGRQEKYIQHLNNALIRIENKSYGICRITGKLIAKQRLRSVPHATTSINAKMSLTA
jgi:DnaK suppressor protein